MSIKTQPQIENTQQNDYNEEEKSTKRYRVVVAETQSYEVYVEAESKEEAEVIAFYGYGENGEIFQTDAEVVEIEEEIR